MRKKWIAVVILAVVLVFVVILIALGASPYPSSISGTVYDNATSQPLEGMTICAYGTDDVSFDCSVTGVDGSYTLENIDRSLFYLKYFPSSQGTYALTYYPDQFLRQDAQLINISVWGYLYPPPEDFTFAHSGFDFHLTPGGSISGQVDLFSQGGLPAIPVCLELPDGTPVYCTQTDASGAYSFIGLISQSYLVHVERPQGFIEQYYPGTFEISGAAPIAVTVPQNTGPINLTLPQVSTISGIVSQDGGPIVIYHSAYPPPNYSGTLAGTQICAIPFSQPGLKRCAKTDDQGSYTIEYLPEGDYLVWADPVLGHAAQYYPASMSSNGATPVHVSPPALTSQVNLILPLANFGSPGSVSGTIYDYDGSGEPLSGVTVCAYLAGSSGSELFSCSTSGTNGIYWIGTGLAQILHYPRITQMEVRLQVIPTEAGTYAISYYPDQFELGNSQVFDLVPGASGFDIHLAPGGSISGQVVLTGEGGLSDAPVCAELPNGYLVTCTRTDSSGNYSLSGLISENYLVHVERPDGYIEQFFPGAFNTSGATPVAVSAPQNTAQINFSLPRVGSISGTIIEVDPGTAKYPPPAGTLVPAHTQVCALPFNQPGLQRCTQSQGDGYYTINYLPEGDYRVWALADSYHVVQYYLSSMYPDGAIPVHVTPDNDTPQINLTLPLVGNTPSGDNVTIMPSIGISISFSTVSVNGTTSVNMLNSAPPVPSGFNLVSSSIYYDLSSTAIFTGPVEVCFPYEPAQFSNPDEIRLLHYENDSWVDVTTSLNITGNSVCGSVISFSEFVVVRKNLITLQARTPAANVYGWNNTDVTIVWSCSDGSYTTPIILTSEGENQFVTGTCYDSSGNTLTDTQTGINIDKTPPTLNPVITPSPIILNGTAVINPGASDSLSGISTQSCGALNTSTVGTKTVSCTATDKAGNSTDRVITYSVIYLFEGFLQPINDTGHTQICGDPCTLSVFKGGSTIPVKFYLKDAAGNIVQASQPPIWIIPQKGSAINTPIGEGVYTDPASNGTTFIWDGSQYHYNWSTKGFQSGYIWRIGVILDDGQTYYVYIGLR